MLGLFTTLLVYNWPFYVIHAAPLPLLSSHSATQHVCCPSWQAAASCWWRPCCLRTDEGPSWLRPSLSTCWCRRRAGSARRPSTRTSSTRPASTTFRCAGPESPTTPSWPSDELGTDKRGVQGSKESSSSRPWNGLEVDRNSYALKTNCCQSQCTWIPQFMLWKKSTPVMFSDVVITVFFQGLQIFSGVKLLLDNIFYQ